MSSHVRTAKEPRHVVCLSGGKDSTALAIYLRERIPDVEYIFTDTGEELEETYEYLVQLEAFLGKPITHLNVDRPFKHWLDMFGGYLPSPRMRWCTRMLKIKPLEAYLGDDAAIMYVGIRADEDREGYITGKPEIRPVYPFKDDGITIDDVYQILDEAGVGLPDYYQWRTRSGCYFCFFQRKREWVGLLQKHPDLFKKAMAFEKVDEAAGKRFTWNQDESLEELARPERVEEIIRKHDEAMERETRNRPRQRLVEVFGEVLDASGTDDPCLICNL